MANWHRELLVSTIDRRKRAALAKCADSTSNHSCPVRFSTNAMIGGYQVFAHVPAKALELMTDEQRTGVEHPVAGDVEQRRPAAKESAAVACVAVLVQLQVLDAAFKPILPADIDVRPRLMPWIDVRITEHSSASFIYVIFYNFWCLRILHATEAARMMPGPGMRAHVGHKRSRPSYCMCAVLPL